MKKLPNTRIQGFASILPLLIIVFLIVSGFTVYNQRRSFSAVQVQKDVLSESDNKSENAGNSGKTENKKEEGGTSESKKISESKETPEPEETIKPKETPEPKETAEPDEFEEEQEVEVKDDGNKSKVKIRSGQNKFEFQQEGAKISVKSDFPLSVNPVTRELTVTTPAGSRVVAVLPEQASSNMITSGVVTSTTGVDLKTESDGSLSYNIDGTKSEKLLGVFDVAVPKNLIVSAETGQVLTVNQSIFSKILDFLSI